jgi:dihydrodipicolinate reductase
MTGFLDLPPEVRNQIYFHCESLVASRTGAYHKSPRRNADGNHIRTARWYAQYDPNNPAKSADLTIDFSNQPNITKVCRTIRNETLPIVYGASGFEILDLYWYRQEGVQTPFPKIVLQW